MLVYYTIFKMISQKVRMLHGVYLHHWKVQFILVNRFIWMDIFHLQM